MFYGFVVTEAGNRLLAQMVAGETLELTRVVMDKGTVESAESARALTAPLEAMVEGTSTLPLVEKNIVNLIVEYRSDLNSGLKAGFWIGGFGIYAKDPSGGADIMLYYGSLGDEKQYVRAYTQGVPPDVRRYPVSITLTEGVEVTVAYPADAWMNAQDVADYFNATLKPELLEEIKLQTDAMTGRVDELELLVDTKETPNGAQAKADAVQSNLNSHAGDKNNPHGVTATQLGAATSSSLTSHIGDKSNPHGVTASQVGAATSSSLTSHTGNKSNPHGVTASQVGAATTSSLTSHTGNKSNPHGVTAAQIGAATANSGIPIGAIMLWSGASTAIPAGWKLCDGANSTPDLRGKFVVGAGGTYVVGNEGGAAAVGLYESQGPSHRHRVLSTSAGDIYESSFMMAGYSRSSEYSYYFEPCKDYLMDTQGNGSPHENRPPYYALCYIMFKG